MNVAVVRKTQQVARPLKVLVPLIQAELSAANDAGLEHYRRAGEMLVEAKEQVAYGAWGRWLTKNFELSDRTAMRYMRLAQAPEKYQDPTSPSPSTSASRGGTLYDAIGEKRSSTKWKPLFEAASNVNVARLADERQNARRRNQAAP